MQITHEALNDFWTGSVTLEANVPLQLPALPLQKCVVLRNEGEGGDTPEAVVRVGKTGGAAAVGFSIPLGDVSPPIYINNFSKLWLVSDKAATVSWIAQ